MKTFAQFKESVVADRIERYGDYCTRAEYAYGITVADWWRREIIPCLNAGESVPRAVCRSIVDNGCNLRWVAKNYEGCLPQYICVATGRILERGLGV